jgi:uncharacterized protein
MNSSALIIFTRNPELGKVKTRLANTMGNEKALQIYTALLERTMEVTENLACDKFVFYDANIATSDIWNNKTYLKVVQTGEDLGERMKNAFLHLKNLGYQKCMIIGSDLFDLETRQIEKAFALLDQNEFVVGPAEDGGYYLLGLTNINDTIFKNKSWGTNTVFTDTLNDLNKFSVALLPILNDIDTEEDLMQSSYYLINVR